MRQAPQEEPRPFLSVLPTAQSSCACAKGKLQLSKTKTPKEELPRWPWKTAGPPPLHRAPWAGSQGLGGTAGHSLAVTQGLTGWPAPMDRKPNLLGGSLRVLLPPHSNLWG